MEEIQVKKSELREEITQKLTTLQDNEIAEKNKSHRK